MTDNTGFASLPWSVTVRLNDKEVVTIEPKLLSGDEITPLARQVVRTSAHLLLAFIGDAAQCSADAVLTEPVRIGNGIFGAGVKVSTALAAAHRNYLYIEEEKKKRLPGQILDVTVCRDGRDFIVELATVMGVIDVGAEPGTKVPVLDLMAMMLARAQEDRQRWHDTPDITGALAKAQTTSMVDALLHVEAVMSIVEPRSNKAEYLETLGEVRAALAITLGRHGYIPPAGPTLPYRDMVVEECAVVLDRLFADVGDAMNQRHAEHDTVAYHQTNGWQQGLGAGAKALRALMLIPRHDTKPPAATTPKPERRLHPYTIKYVRELADQIGGTDSIDGLFLHALCDECETDNGVLDAPAGGTP